MDAIVTKYHGPTETRGSRYSATFNGKRLYVATDHSLDSIGNHTNAVRRFCKKHGIPAERDRSLTFTPGRHGSCYVWCALNSSAITIGGD